LCQEFAVEIEFYNKRYMLPVSINTSENILTVQNRKAWKWFPIQCSPISDRALLFGRLPEFHHLSSGKRRRWAWSIDGNKLAGENWILEEKSFPVPLCPSHILHGLSWDRIRACTARGRRL